MKTIQKIGLYSINYQPMSVSQNMKQSNSNINFTGKPTRNVKRFVEDYAKKYIRGSAKEEQKYINETMNSIKEQAKEYHPDLYIDRRQYVYNGKVVGDDWILGHKKLPSSQYEITVGSAGGDWRYKSISADFGYDSKRDEEFLINKLMWQVIENSKRNKGSAELIDVIDQLARHIGDKDYYRENMIPRLNKKFNINIKENVSIGKVKRTEDAHIQRVYKDDIIQKEDPLEGIYDDHHSIEFGDEDKIRFVPGFVGWLTPKF